MLLRWSASSSALVAGSLLLLGLLLVASSPADTLTLVEFIVGPKLGRATDSVTPKSVRTSSAQELVNGYGYPFEEHEVHSEDGYILTLHRIPRSPHTKRKQKTTRPIALFQHGLLASSDSFLFQNPENGLPYLLADAGYDVWLTNMRGNVYSNKHTKMDPKKDADYWRFSLHEIGYYDLPATIDYILNNTNQKSVYYMGHSIGSSVAFIMGSLKPEYNSKIKLHLALAPLIHALHDMSFTHRVALLFWRAVKDSVITDEILNVFPRRKYFSDVLDTLCADGMPTQLVCLMVTFSFVGVDTEQFNTSIIADLVSYYPAGSSVYLIQHTAQIYNEKDFRPLDYEDKEMNYKMYNSSIIPAYNLSLVTHPVSFHYGDSDLLVTEQDLSYTKNMLPNSVGMFRIPYDSFNHMDFMVGSSAKDLLYKDLILLMSKYK